MRFAPTPLQLNNLFISEFILACADAAEVPGTEIPPGGPLDLEKYGEVTAKEAAPLGSLEVDGFVDGEAEEPGVLRGYPRLSGED